MTDALPKPSAPPMELDYVVPEISTPTATRAEAEQQNEIVALNDTDDHWKLELGDGFQRQWEEIMAALTAVINEDDDRISVDTDTTSMSDSTYLTDDKVFIISLLGNTSSGKSFIARYLLDDSSNNDGPVSIDEEEKKGATTVNINCYVNESATNQKTLVLDYEGEKGSGFPLFHYARRGLAHISRTAEKAQQRRQAVTDYFPKLAYILSDVVILLGNDDLASTDYLTRCREFALKANDGVSQMVHRPVLIIIQNKASLAQSLKYDVITRNFFEIHGQEAAALRPYFSDIKCFCFPHNLQMQRTKTGVLDGQEIFNRQMADVKDIFSTLRNHNSERSLTHAQWLYLLQRVLQIVQSGKSVSLHTLLSEIVIQDGDQTIKTIKYCFLYFYILQPIHSPEWFDACCHLAIRVLAHCLAEKAFGQRELMSERIIHEQCEKALEQLSRELDEFQPCEALYTGKGRSSKNKDQEHAVYCNQHKGAHAGGHRTCESVYGLTPWKEFWGWSSTDVWPGEFVCSTRNEKNNSIFSDIITRDLPRMVRELMVAFQQNPEAIYHMFTDIFRSWCDEKPIEIFSRICFGASSSTSASTDPSNLKSNTGHQRLRRGALGLLRMQYLLLSSFGPPYPLRAVCRTCYKELDNAWNRSPTHTLSPIADAFSPRLREVADCAICFDGKRDYLFIPCGHRGFCERCADNFLREERPCPFCRASITGKQRVHDV